MIIIKKLYLTLYFYIYYKVVMSVAQLYHHLAPKSEVNVIAKALIRLLRSHREVQSVVLNSIASISITRKVFF